MTAQTVRKTSGPVSYKEQQAKWRKEVDSLKQRVLDRMDTINTDAQLANVVLAALNHPHRSFRNAILIEDAHARAVEEGKAPQGPTTSVATYKEWLKVGRRVRKGQHGYPIIQPVKASFWRDQEGNSHRITRHHRAPDGAATFTKVVSWRPNYVFDVSQTTGLEYTPTARPQLTAEGMDKPSNTRISQALQAILVTQYPGIMPAQTNQELVEQIAAYTTSLVLANPVTVYTTGEDGKSQQIPIPNNPTLDSVRAWAVAGAICATLEIPNDTPWSNSPLPIPEMPGVERGKIVAALCENIHHTNITAVSHITQKADIENPLLAPRIKQYPLDTRQTDPVIAATPSSQVLPHIPTPTEQPEGVGL